VLDDVLAAAQREGYGVRGLIASPRKGPAGNAEFLAWMALPAADGAGHGADRAALIAAAVRAAHAGAAPDGGHGDPPPSLG